MKAICRLMVAALFVAPAASATKIPIPIEGATLNVSFQLQTQMLFNENGAPSGADPSFDVYVRRSRILINGDISQNFSYLVQVDNPNFGKFGNYTGRAIVQDAWIGWAPTGITGPNVLYVDAGLLLIPISHHLLESTTNFVTADVHSDNFRLGSNAQYQALRETGVQVRGWWLDKKIGFRGGVYEGLQPAQSGGFNGTAAVCNVVPTGGTVPSACSNPKRLPQLGGFVNFDIIGSEEGGWLYGAYKWGKDPIVSVHLSGIYQSLAVKNLSGNWTDQKYAGAGLYVNWPMTEAAEFVLEVEGNRSSSGAGSGNTGYGLSADAGYRMGAIAPYIGYEYFQSDDCGDLAAPTCLTNGAVAGGPDTANTRNIRAGLNFFFNKNLNHLNLEFSANHGQSAYGNTAITAASAGYAPIGVTTNLRKAVNKSVLLHWNVLF